MTMTRVVVNITRHETAVFEFEGDRCGAEALLLIESGEIDPVRSKIHHEDIDIVDFNTVVSS